MGRGGGRVQAWIRAIDIMVDQAWRCAGAERGVEVALSTRSLLPSQCSCMPCFFAWFQMVGNPLPEQLVVAGLDRVVEQCLGRVERVDPSRPQSG